MHAQASSLKTVALSPDGTTIASVNGNVTCPDNGVHWAQAEPPTKPNQVAKLVWLLLLSIFRFPPCFSRWVAAEAAAEWEAQMTPGRQSAVKNCCEEFKEKLCVTFFSVAVHFVAMCGGNGRAADPKVPLITILNST